jgi:hypothetical protein
VTWRVLVAFALLGAVASPTAAVAPPGIRWMITHDGDRIAAMPGNGDTAAPDRVEGKGLAIDPRHGSSCSGPTRG